jgi:hypothetical protein
MIMVEKLRSCFVVTVATLMQCVEACFHDPCKGQAISCGT